MVAHGGISPSSFEILLEYKPQDRPVDAHSFWTWSLAADVLQLEVLSQVLPGCDTTNCAVPGKDLHNNTIRTLELSLQAAGTDE